MKYQHLYLAIALIALTPLLCWAEKEKLIIDVDQPSQMKMPIVVPDFPSDPTGAVNGKDMAAVIRNNLNATGLFQIVEPPPGMESLDPDSDMWKAGGAQALVTGKYTINGAEISMDLRLYDLALKKMELGKRYTGDTQFYRKILHMFSDRILERLTGVLGCFSSKIAFVGVGRSRELFMMDYDGFNLAQLTRNNSITMSPDWAPNNSGLIFTSYLRRNPDLWRLDLNTLRQHPISSRPGINASARYSPDGTSIALSLSVNSVPNIFLITPDGSIIKQLTSGRGNDISPAWSPDGARLAYVSDQTGSPQIYTRPTAGGPGVRVSLQGSYNTDPDWSPKGDLIAYTTRVNGRFQICTIKTDGTDFKTLTSVGSNEDPVWSPDGRMIAFVSNRNGSKHIYVMDAKGLVQTQVSRTPGKSPTWSKNFN